VLDKATGSTVFYLPTVEEAPLQQLLQAMESAEAAQQQLMQSGALAEAASQGNLLLKGMLESYSTAQQLFHKAMRGFLQEFGQLAATPAGAPPAACWHP
jgi:hypothetical protein